MAESEDAFLERKLFEKVLVEQQNYLLSAARVLLRNFYDCGNNLSVDDIIQQVNMAALKGYTSFDGRNIRGWLHIIMRNTIRNNRVRASYRSYIPIEQDENLNRPLGPALRREETVSAKLEYRDLQRALKHMPEKYKNIIILKMRGYSTGEIIDILKIKDSTFFYRQKIAQEKLKEFMTTGVPKKINPYKIPQDFRDKYPQYYQ